MKNIKQWLSIIHDKTINVFGIKLKKVSFIAICILLTLSVYHTFAFIVAVASAGFFSAIFNIILFTWNTSWAYYHYLNSNLIHKLEEMKK